jgi:hypothetical protein
MDDVEKILDPTGTQMPPLGDSACSQLLYWLCYTSSSFSTCTAHYSMSGAINVLPNSSKTSFLVTFIELLHSFYYCMSQTRAHAQTTESGKRASVYLIFYTDILLPLHLQYQPNSQFCYSNCLFQAWIFIFQNTVWEELIPYFPFTTICVSELISRKKTI